MTVRGRMMFKKIKNVPWSCFGYGKTVLLMILFLYLSSLSKHFNKSIIKPSVIINV